MRKVTVKKGRHDFRPNTGLRITTGSKIIRNKQEKNTSLFDIKFLFKENCWFDPTINGPIQRDGKDINKLGGVSFGNLFKPKQWPKNKNSILVGFRPSDVKGFIELHGYINYTDGSFSSVYLGAVAVDTQASVSVSYRLVDSKLEVDFSLTGDGVTSTEQLSLVWGDNHWGNFAINVDTWFGGNRKAPQKMNLLVKQKNYW